AACDTPVNIGDDEEDHAANDCGDHNLIKQIDVIHNWVMLRAWHIVTHPRAGEVGGGIRVTSLTFDQQVLAQGNACLGRIHFCNVMYTMTICANRFVRWL